MEIKNRSDGGEAMTREQQERALAILHSMAVERTGWRAFFGRWWIDHEPLRNDAANLIREIGYLQKMPEDCQLVGTMEGEP
jgi:hypothetical protein